MLVADAQAGYLGSANLSGRALDENFEIGVSLMPRQARALDGLISFLESRGTLQDQTATALP
jgi:phosphatidylserine/phosphatidylglycerophosphate/cardiolipin synthase-like enzyme